MQQSRLDKAKQIIEQPENFKVCEACGSIVTRTTMVCPNCNAYRFDSNPEYVAEQAVLLASRAQRSVTLEDMELTDWTVRNIFTDCVSYLCITYER